MAGAPTDPDAPTEALVSSAVGDRCVSCGAPLSSDQRYCVVCGERRGAPRFTLPAPAATVVTETTRSAPSPRRRPRLGSGTTLVAGVATLLLALLVGVVIGHSAADNSTKTVAAGPTRVTIAGGGAAAPSSGAPAASSSGSSSSGSGSGSGSSSGSGSGSGSHSSSSKPSHAKTKKSASNSTAVHTTTISKQVATQAQQAAQKVTGGNNVPPATDTVGSSCKAGSAGCNSKTGKFDGSFFGQ